MFVFSCIIFMIFQFFLLVKITLNTIKHCYINHALTYIIVDYLAAKAIILASLPFACFLIRAVLITLGGEDTAHGTLPRLVSIHTNRYRIKKQSSIQFSKVYDYKNVLSTFILIKKEPSYSISLQKA